MSNKTEAQLALEILRDTIDQALGDLKSKAESGGGKLGDWPDKNQQAAYALAESSAEFLAAEFLNENASAGSDFNRRMAESFVAQTYASIRSRLETHIGHFGWSSRDWNARWENDTIRDWLIKNRSAEELESLGVELLSGSGNLGFNDLTEEQRIMQQTFESFAKENVAPLAEEIHRHDKDIPPEILNPLKEMGVFGLSIPERFGGLQNDSGEDNMGMILVTEALSTGSLGAAGSLITRPEILSRALMAGGTDEQRETWLPLLASGEKLCAVAVTEPDYGSDVAAMRFSATKTNSGWLMNGTKTWLTFGGKAEVYLLLARTDPDMKKGHKGLSVFLAEKPSFPGHEFEHKQEKGGSMRGRAISTVGYRGMHSFEVFFEDYFVPDSHLLGGEAGLGKGFYAIMEGFSGGRIQTAARALGVMQAAFDLAIEYANARKVFGIPLAETQLTRIKAARMGMLLAACRRFTYGVARLMDAGEGRMEASLVKFFACKASEWITREGMQIHGGMGYAEECAASRYWLDARVLSIFEGAEETLAIKVISRSLLDKGRLPEKK